LREQIKRLMGLQSLDRQLREMEEKLATIAGRVTELREQTARDQAELDRLTRESDEAANTRKKMERELAESEARLRNKRMRQNLVRNDKELMALGIEVDSLKENNQRLEAELLAMMEAADPRASQLKTLGESLSAARETLATLEKEIETEVEELNAQLGQRRAERSRAIGEIDKPLLARYEIIFARRQGLAVARAKDGTCTGCRRSLPPQLFNEIQREKQPAVHFCPACQRILFYEPETE